MKIGILVRGLPPGEIGGSEIQAHNLAVALCECRHNVSVFSNNGKGNRPYKLYRSWYVNIPGLRWFMKVFSTLAHIRTNKPDVLICYLFHDAGIIGGLASLLFGIKSYSFVRGEGCYKGGWIHRRLTGFIVRNSASVLVQSEKIKKDFLRHYKHKKIVVIPNGILPTKADKSKKRYDVAYVGRLVRDEVNDKGVRYLLEAVKDTDYKTVIIGYGDEECTLRKRAGQNVVFLGKLPHQEALTQLVQAKIMVFPTIYGDGFPNAVLEAMELGLPVIATDTTGVPGLVEHKKTGFVVERRNSKQIRKYIGVLLEDNMLHKQMSRECKKKAKGYYWNNIVKQIEDVLNN